MDRVSINTSQNVKIDFQAAGIGDRTIAALIDYLIIVSYLIAGVFILSNVNSTALMVLFALPVVFYFLISEIVFNGQSIGKKVRGIKVARLDGRQPGIGDYLLRWVFRLFEVDLTGGMIALVTMFVRANGQRLGDVVAGTIVIRQAPAVRLEDTLYTQTDTRYEVTFPQVDQLTDADLRLVRDVLDKIQKNHPEANQLGQRLQDALENKLSLSSSLDPRYFLETVLKDYNHIRQG